MSRVDHNKKENQKIVHFCILNANIIQKKVSNYIEIKVNGNNIICSENHKWIIFRDGEVVEVLAKDIKYSDYFLLKR
jgi:intein/homing endonuclease